MATVETLFKYWLDTDCVNLKVFKKCDTHMFFLVLAKFFVDIDNAEGSLLYKFIQYLKLTSTVTSCNFRCTYLHICTCALFFFGQSP